MGMFGSHCGERILLVERGNGFDMRTYADKEALLRDLLGGILGLQGPDALARVRDETIPAIFREYAEAEARSRAERDAEEEEEET